jgi:hypothetical protein
MFSEALIQNFRLSVIEIQKNKVLKWRTLLLSVLGLRIFHALHMAAETGIKNLFSFWLIMFILQHHFKTKLFHCKCLFTEFPPQSIACENSHTCNLYAHPC